MTRATRLGLVVRSGISGGLVFPTCAWADHPASGGGGAWAWLGLLAVVLAAVIWPVLAFFERRQKLPAERRRRPKS
jgi:heme exporter protein D